MSTKTGYTQLVSMLSSPVEVKVSNCTAMHLWTVVRHGTRYPSKQAIKLMQEDLGHMHVRIMEAVKDGRSSLCNEDVEEMKKWKVEVREDQAKLLHPEGEREMVLLGERWLNRLGDLLVNYEEDLYRLRSTNTQRAQQSGQSFATGLWTRLVSRSLKWEQVDQEHDPLIRFYKLCGKWKSEVKRNPDSLKERNLFEKSQVMKDLMLNMTTFLGLSTSPLTISDLDIMYVMCNFDLAWQPSKNSPWCNMFPRQGLQLMEYREDLEYFWVDGPGYPVTAQQACVLAKDMMDTFRNISMGMVATKGSFYFTHSGTILKLLTFLKVGLDGSTLRSDNVMEMEDRGWRTSILGPFGANVAFVLQKCETESDQLEWRIGLWVNEILTLIPGCEEVWCKMEDFLEAFPQIENCDFDTVCNSDDSGEHIDLPDDKY